MLYPKIQTLFKRTEKGELILGDWTDPTFKYLAGLPWRCTEKINGTNIRIIISPLKDKSPWVYFGGRTENAQLSAKLVDWLTAKFRSDEMLETLNKKFPDGGTLFGEGFGAGIQKGGGNYQDFQSFILFDVRVGDWWLQWQDVMNVAETLEIPHVPVVGVSTLSQAISVVEDGLESEFGSFSAEGIVAEPVVPLLNRKGDRVIAKIKTRDFERAVEKE